MHFYLQQLCEFLASLVALGMAEVAVVAAAAQLGADTPATRVASSASSSSDDSDHHHHPNPKDGAAPREKLRQNSKPKSPVSIEADFGLVSKANQEKLLPLTTVTTLMVYASLVRKNYWDARFLRGQRSETPEDWLRVHDREFVRRLATRHIGDAATDGWNCVAGAVQLINAWALQSTEIPHLIPPSFELPFNARLRMAVCLNVSWKFQRAQYSRFPRQFYNLEDEPPSLLAPHTYEMAFIGFSFMTEDEQKLFGGWSNDNVRAIRAMYDEMLAHEVNLVSYVDVFTLLTNNVQVKTEWWLHDMLARCPELSADCALAARSLVPFFMYCTRRGAEPSAGALVCAALLALSTTSNPRAKLRYSPEFFRTEFGVKDRSAAWGLIDSALHPSNLAEHMVVLGCYKDPAWENYCFVEAQNLRVAQVAAAAVA